MKDITTIDPNAEPIIPISKVVEHYAWDLINILTAVSLGLLTIFGRKISKKLETLSKATGPFDNTTINSKMGDYIKVNNSLDKIRGLLEGDRALLIQIHNGEKLLSNYHLLRWSITHQVVKKGIERVKMLSNQPIERIIQEYVISTQQDYIYVNSITEEGYLSILCKDYLKSIASETIMIFQLKNKFNIQMGLVGVHFINSRPELTKEELEDVKKAISEIGEIY